MKTKPKVEDIKEKSKTSIETLTEREPMTGRPNYKRKSERQHACSER